MSSLNRDKQEKLIVVWLHGTEAVYLGALYPM